MIIYDKTWRRRMAIRRNAFAYRETADTEWGLFVWAVFWAAMVVGMGLWQGMS